MTHLSSNFISKEEIEDDLYNELEHIYYSAGEGDDDHRRKIEKMDLRVTPREGFFEKIKYFDKVFPSLKI